MMNWLHNDYFTIWHFLYQQLQLDNWFGNIVAGIIAWLILTALWQWILKDKFQSFLSNTHKRALNLHYERIQKAEEKRHKETMAQSAKYHQERLIQQEDHNRRIMDHVTNRLNEHHEKLKQHISDTLNGDRSQTSN